MQAAALAGLEQKYTEMPKERWESFVNESEAEIPGLERNFVESWGKLRK
jgi:hypothetical protein